MGVAGVGGGQLLGDGETGLEVLGRRSCSSG
jgi:hypothetical protein